MSSTILFCLIARDKDVLAEYTPQSGNFTTVTLMLLNKFPKQDGKMSYLYDRSAAATRCAACRSPERGGHPACPRGAAATCSTTCGRTGSSTCA